MADNRPELCLLYSSCTVGGCNSDDRHADDSKNLCIRVDSIDRLQGNKKRNSVKIIFAFKKKSEYNCLKQAAGEPKSRHSPAACFTFIDA